MDWVQDFFADKYHDLNLTQNLSEGQTGYHSVSAVVPTRDITSKFDNPTMAVTAEQIHIYQPMAKIIQLTDTNKILGGQTKQLAKMNVII